MSSLEVMPFKISLSISLFKEDVDSSKITIFLEKKYILAIEQQRAGKRSQYVAEMEREKVELVQLKESEDFRQQVVAEARKRLLAEHAVKLKGFLPKGILRNREEYDLVQSSAAAQMAAGGRR